MDGGAQDQLEITSSRPQGAPRNHRFASGARRQIIDRSLAERAAASFERSITEERGVSRMTARRALEAKGLVYGEDGRGRFAAPGRVAYDVSNTSSFAAHADNRDLALNIEEIRDPSGSTFCLRRQLWRGEEAEFSARAIAGGDADV